MTPDEMAENVRQLYRSLDIDTEDFQAYLGPQQFVLNDHYHHEKSWFCQISQDDRWIYFSLEGSIIIRISPFRS